MFILLNCLFGDMYFKEIKYISAFDITTNKYGSLSIINDILTIKYSEPEKKIIKYFDNKILIEENSNLEEFSFENYPQPQYMGLILKAIIYENFNSLEQFFKIKYKNNDIILESRGIMMNNIEYIEINKNKKTIKEIILHMTNEDKITIETIK
jgi:hypothetical protein